MKLSQLFLPNTEKTERKLTELMNDYSKEESYIQKLERLKTCGLREKKKEFLETFAKNLPYFIKKVRKKMEQTNIDIIYLDDHEDYKTRDYGYRTKLELRHDGHLYFLHSLSGNTYKADLDDIEFYGYDGYAPLYDYLNTYPDKKNLYTFYTEDTIERHFKIGKEMYEGIKLFLKENKTL